jgi:hypothetical protein
MELQVPNGEGFMIKELNSITINESKIVCYLYERFIDYDKEYEPNINEFKIIVIEPARYYQGVNLLNYGYKTTLRHNSKFIIDCFSE